MTDQDSGLRNSRFQTTVTASVPRLDLSLGLALSLRCRWSPCTCHALPLSLDESLMAHYPDGGVAAGEGTSGNAPCAPLAIGGSNPVEEPTANAHQVQEKRTIEASSPPAHPQKTVNEEKTGFVVLPVVYHVAAALERAKAAQDAWFELSTGKSV
ncbi:hypothetical protein VTG60DRAFT_6372 [Thermothelomyces hinnuleus]